MDEQTNLNKYQIDPKVHVLNRDLVHVFRHKTFSVVYDMFKCSFSRAIKEIVKTGTTERSVILLLTHLEYENFFFSFFFLGFVSLEMLKEI